jgi:hypothetical protein
MMTSSSHGPSRVRTALAFLLCLLTVSLSGCGGQAGNETSRESADETVEAASTDARTDRQTAFRVRGDFSAGLNEASGWVGEVNESTTVQADQPFRLRFEVDAAGKARKDRQYRLQVRRNGGDWIPLPAENFPQPAKLYEFPLGSEFGRRAGDAWRVEAGDLGAMNWRADGEGGRLEVATGELALLAIARADVHWRPVEFAAEIRFDEERAGPAGLVFDYRDGANYSRVDVMPTDSVRLVRVDNGTEAVVADHSAVVEPGRWLELEIALGDGELRVEFDDAALAFAEPLPARGVSPGAGIYLPAGSAAAYRSILAEGEPHSPRSSIVASPVFDHGQPTEDLLPVSDRPFNGGAGVSFSDRTPVWAAEDGQGEWAFPIVIRRFSDGAALNESGDRFDYRLVDLESDALASESVASVSLAVPDRHLGGTFAETPMRLGPWQADNGDLYFPMEPSETWNRLMMVKSADGGRSWREVDGANRPDTGDLEGFASILAGDRIHMLHQTSDDVWYHAFNTADHAQAPDRWLIRDERLASPGQPPTQVADLAVRSDGSVVAVYGGPDDIRVRTRSSDGEWGEPEVIDAPGDAAVSGPSLVPGRRDVVYLAYTVSDGTGWFRRLDSDGTLSDPVRFASDLASGEEDVGSILPLLYLAESDSVSIIYRTANGRLFERRVGADGAWSDPVAVSNRRVVQNAVDSDQAGADAVVDSEAVHALFIEQGTGRLFHASRLEDSWSEAELLVDGGDVQWVRGAVLQLPGVGRVYGFVYDAGSDGGSGMNRFSHVVLRNP